MFIIKSEFSQKPSLRGKSLADLFGLSTRKSSLKNLNSFVEGVQEASHTSELDGRVMNFPNMTSYFHPVHLREVYTHLQYLVIEHSVTIEFSVFDSRLIDLLGESVMRGVLDIDDVLIELELPSGGRIVQLYFDKQGRIHNWPVGYFEPSAPFDLGL